MIHHTEEVAIGIKQLHKDLKRVTQSAANGKTFIIMNHTKPLCRIGPIPKQKKKKYTLNDLLSIRFDNDDKDLSKKIDHYVYGV